MFEKVYGKYWKTIVETMQEGLMLVSPEGTIVYVNDALKRMSGYSKEDLVGKSCEVLGCDSCFGTRDQAKDKYCALFTEEQVSKKKCTFIKKDNTLVPVLKNAIVIRDSTGRVIGGVENMTDLAPAVAKDQVISRLRQQLLDKDGFQDMIGKSTAMQQVFDLIDSVAHSDAPVVICGESGTGKELAAAAIHRLSPRSNGPFIKVNCAALNENLLESELFGHVRGSFTGAETTRIGRFEAASGGTIFLDEIGDMPMTIQTKLLRVLQEKEIERVGDHKPIPVDVRILAATNQDLCSLTAKNRFREDLYYRIWVIPVHMPPLRKRREDIPLLIEAFIEQTRLKTDKPISGINKETLEILINWDWPGNVRELINVIEHGFVLCSRGEIRPEHIPGKITGSDLAQNPIKPASHYRNITDQFEQIESALAATDGNKAAAAKMLGISRVTLYKRIQKLGIKEK